VKGLCLADRSQLTVCVLVARLAVPVGMLQLECTDASAHLVADLWVRCASDVEVASIGAFDE